MDPSSMALMYFETDMEDILDIFSPLKFENKKYVIIPINDKEDKHQAVGGSHWALLLYVVGEDYFVYFDSSSGVIPTIYDVANKVNAVKNKTTKLLDEKTLKIIHYKNSPKQINSYDCGMYVLSLAEALAERLLKETKPLDDKAEEFDFVKPSYITKKRKEIYDLINDLVAKKGK